MRITDLKEKLKEEKLDDYVRRIQDLSEKKIDDLWKTCGVVVSSLEKGLVALTPRIIDDIKNNQGAKEIVWSLIRKTRLQDFEKYLNDLENV